MTVCTAARPWLAAITAVCLTACFDGSNQPVTVNTPVPPAQTPTTPTTPTPTPPAATTPVRSISETTLKEVRFPVPVIRYVIR